MVRDEALATSGLLVEKIGGLAYGPISRRVSGKPSPCGKAIRVFTSVTAERICIAAAFIRFEARLRRFYFALKFFNAPNRQASCVRRERTDTPLQALVTLNDPQFVEAARNLAEHSLKEGGTKRCGVTD